MIADNKLLIGLAAVGIIYLAVRLFTVANRNNRLYHDEIERILTAKEHKVKGRFD